jgi:SAM-dependent methyltransferase
MSVLSLVHGRLYRRRLRVLAGQIADLLPERASVVDIGCGDGALARHVMARRPDVRIEGLDVLVRPSTHIPVHHFDGLTLPYADCSVDVATIIDVLHHAEDPKALLNEARRVARLAVVIKDHLADRPGAIPTLRTMDWVGNVRFGVRLPYTYWRWDEWTAMWREAGLSVRAFTTAVPLYPFPLSALFGWRLHFVADLDPTATDGRSPAPGLPVRVRADAKLNA